MMRHLALYTRDHATDAVKFQVIKYRMDLLGAPENKRDFYLRAMSVAPGFVPKFYLFNTLAAANDVTLTDYPDPDDYTALGVVGYHTGGFTLNGLFSSKIITNHAGVAPDVTDLVIEITGYDIGSVWDSVWIYTASPWVNILDEIFYQLGQRSSEGQSMYGYSTERMFKGEEGLEVASANRQIIGGMVEAVPAVHGQKRFALDVNITLAIGEVGGVRDTLYDSVQTVAGSVMSILVDEERTLAGLVDEFTLQSVGGPERVKGEEEMFNAATLRGVAKVLHMFSDV